MPWIMTLTTTSWCALYWKSPNRKLMLRLLEHNQHLDSRCSESAVISTIDAASHSNRLEAPLSHRSKLSRSVPRCNVSVSEEH